MNVQNRELASEDQQYPIGLSAFDNLWAEDEPWLHRCFVPPPNFQRMAGTKSALIFGATGSGKTALFRMMLRELQDPREESHDPLQEAEKDSQENQVPSPQNLVVNWRLQPLEPDDVGTTAAEKMLAQVLAQCAERLLAHLACWPDRFLNAPADVQAKLIWIVHRYLTPGTQDRIRFHLDSTDGPHRPELRNLLTSRPSNPFLAKAKTRTIINEAVKNVRQIGLQRVCVLLGPDAADDWDPWLQSLYALFSSLSLFENQLFVYKIVLPKNLKDTLQRAGVVNTKRIVPYSLEWSKADLARIVVRRTAAAAGENLCGLSDVCLDPNITTWLERTGGAQPRGWLESAASVAAEYLQNRRPITIKEWRAARIKSPPLFAFDQETGHTVVGHQPVEELASVPLALLRYLWENRGRACSKRELFDNAWLPTRHPDTPPDEIKKFPKDPDHLIETAISRLREKVEPDASKPTYIVTVRDRGYKLEHAW